jgi:hypothetical protein
VRNRLPHILIITSLLCACPYAAHAAKKKVAAAKTKTALFTGKWCVSNEGLVISFSGKDSMSIGSHRDKQTLGSGTFAKTDSLLTASVVKDSLPIEMVYLYKVQNDSTIKAKIISMVVDGDSADHPTRWLLMQRCNPCTFVFADTLAKPQASE